MLVVSSSYRNEHKLAVRKAEMLSRQCPGKRTQTSQPLSRVAPPYMQGKGKINSHPFFFLMNGINTFLGLCRSLKGLAQSRSSTKYHILRRMTHEAEIQIEMTTMHSGRCIWSSYKFSHKQ